MRAKTKQTIKGQSSLRSYPSFGTLAQGHHSNGVSVLLKWVGCLAPGSGDHSTQPPTGSLRGHSFLFRAHRTGVEPGRGSFPGKGRACLPAPHPEPDKTVVPAYYFISFFSRLLMKSLASSEISSNASSSKSQVAEVTLAKVSLSLSPMKGDSPLTLGEKSQRTRMKGS